MSKVKGETFTKYEVTKAIKAFLEAGNQMCEEANGRYALFSELNRGWDARCLRWHLNMLMTEGWGK